MSRETIGWLNTRTVIGFTDKRGNAWHFDAAAQGTEPNHYAGAIPVADVKRRLFHTDAVTAPVECTVITPEGVFSVEDTSRVCVVMPGQWEVLGVHGEGYQVHQYGDWLLDTVSTVLGDTLSIGSAGLLKNGAVAWVSVEVPDSILTPEGVMFRPNLLAVTSHDGSLATTYKRVVTNVVCDNTMAAGLAEQGQVYRVKHTRNSRARIGDARAALQMIETAADDFQAEVKALCETTVTDQQWAAFLQELAPMPEDDGRSKTMVENKWADLTQLWKADDRVTPWKNTGWGVLQAVNTYTHHLQTVRGTDRQERNMLRAVSGGCDTLDQSTLGTLVRVLAPAL